MELTARPDGRWSAPRFGELRLVRDDVSAIARLLYRVMGVADPAHYLHHLYVKRGLALAGSIRPAAILDAGCGAGDHAVWLARHFADASVLGVDIDQTRIAASRASSSRMRFGNLRFEVADLARLDMQDAVDLVVSVDVLEHIVEQRTALRQLYLALRPGGSAVLHVPTKRERAVPLSRRLHDFHEWASHEHVAEDATADEFIQRVREAGFDVRASLRTFGYWTGELATSLFALAYKDSTLNRVFQACLAPLGRILVLLDPILPQRTRYGVLVVASRPRQEQPI